MLVRNLVHLSSWCLLQLLAILSTLSLSLFLPSLGRGGEGNLAALCLPALYSVSSFNVG